MVKGNRPVPFEQTSQAEPLGEWDAGYRWRARNHGTFLATRARLLELANPPRLSDEDLHAVFGRIPGTQNPPAIAQKQYEHLMELLQIERAL
jgi:hypothetical protein